jgi:hypothetical protein
MSADPAYAAINPPNVNVTNTDNDSAGITVNPTMGLTTTEGGGQATFTIVLNSQPTADVTIPIHVNAAGVGEGTVSPASVTFTMANWNSPRTITVTGVNDDVADGDKPYKVVTDPATSTDPNYSMRDAADVDVTNTDNDSAGITVTPTMGLTTTENPSAMGHTATFTIVLNSQPSGTNTVVIPIRSSNTAEGTVSPSSVTFTTANWNAAQTVTVTGVDDAVQDGNQPYTIITDPATSGDANYNMRDGADVSVSNIDNDSAGITVIPTMGLVTNENPSAGNHSDTFTIVLTSQPTGSVTIGLSSSNPNEGSVSPSSVTFTTMNWNSAQTVTVTGVDDAVQDGDQSYTIVTAQAASTDGNYSIINPPDVSVTNRDNDTADIIVSPTSGLTTTEAGGTATFTIVLNSQPTADVTIGLSSSDTTEGDVSPKTYTFTTANWNMAHTFTVTGANDDVADGNQAYTIVTTATSADTRYNMINPSDVSVTNTDNDTAGFTVMPTSGLVTTEGPGPQHTATFTIALNTRPRGNNSVTVNLTSSDEGEGTVSPSSFTFVNANWNVPQTFTLTGVDDSMIDGDQGYTITITSTSGDPAYNNFPSIPTVSATNTDNDSAVINVAPATCSTSPLMSDTFTISLSSQPTGPVTILVHSDRPTEGDVTAPLGGSVVLNSSNWNTGVQVTVTGAAPTGAPPGSMVMYSIITDAATSTDTNYNGRNPVDVSCTNTQ